MDHFYKVFCGWLLICVLSFLGGAFVADKQIEAAKKINPCDKSVPLTLNCGTLPQGQDSGSCILENYYTLLSANKIDVNREVKVLAF